MEDEEKVFSLGAVDYITKPFRKSTVTARVRTQLKIQEQMRLIEGLSFADTLTGIPNRRCFDSRLAIEWGRAIREKAPLALLMIDVDRFKAFNDSYGHQQGDEALKVVAATIRSELKRQTDLAARWGGEEFVALLPNTFIDNALFIAEHIREAVSKALIYSLVDGAPLGVTVSVGVAVMIPGQDDQTRELVERADKALYVAKDLGRNRVFAFDHHSPAG